MPQWKHVTIARLSMTNFKRFYGTHELDLLTEPDLDKTLVLIGGDNGRGKTSIHEAVNYVFYEDDDLPGIQTRPNYLRAVSDRLNRRALDEGKADYRVGLELLVSGGDAQRRLWIERSWEVDVPGRRAMVPVLTVEENGRPVTWLDESPAAYQDFVRHILPPQIAPFFFFDGERIQDFAAEEGHDRRMVAAVEDILHISVYKTLREDLRKYVVDHIEKHEVKAVETGDFFKLQEEAERIQTDLDEKRERLMDTEREIAEAQARERAIRDELLRIASPHSSDRDDLVLERDRLDRELATAKADIQSGFEPLPILLAGHLAATLRETLEREQGGPGTPEQLASLRQRVEEVEKRVFVSPIPAPPDKVAMKEEQVVFYRQAYQAAASEVFELGSSVPRLHLHDLSETERQRILSRLADATQKSALLREGIDRRERLASELRDVEGKLLSTSDDPHVAELVRSKQQVDQLIGRLEGERDSLRGETQQLERDLAIRKRQIEERQERRKATTEAMKAVKLGRKAQHVLDDFIRKLAPEKLSVLKRHLSDMYARLRKPEDAVQRVDIDPETWQVRLFDEKDRPLVRTVFSAGMREIYALALLWALARASGRELPIVIDTPAARFDRANRLSLFEKYLPHAGHQVVVLSLDTEVDVEWARRLSPYVARQYRLDYDAGTDSTVIRQGYFF
jgi:DNA sulfur modification protein DndD